MSTYQQRAQKSSLLSQQKRLVTLFVQACVMLSSQNTKTVTKNKKRRGKKDDIQRYMII